MKNNVSLTFKEVLTSSTIPVSGASVAGALALRLAGAEHVRV